MEGLCNRGLSSLLVRDKELSYNRREQCGTQCECQEGSSQCLGANLATGHQQSWH